MPDTFTFEEAQQVAPTAKSDSFTFEEAQKPETFGWDEAQIASVIPATDPRRLNLTPVDSDKALTPALVPYGTPPPKSLWEQLNTPVTTALPPAVRKVGRQLTGGGAIEAAGNLLPKDSTTGKVLRGTGQGLEDVGESMLSSVGIATALVQAPKAAARVISAAFAVMAGKGVAEEAKPFVQAVKNKDWETAAKLGVSIIGGAAITAGAGAHAAHEILPAVPETKFKVEGPPKPAELTDEPPTEGVQNASAIPSPASVPEPALRSPVGEEAPLRQPGEAAGAQGKPPDEEPLRPQSPPPPEGEVAAPAPAEKPVSEMNYEEYEAYKRKMGIEPNPITASLLAPSAESVPVKAAEAKPATPEQEYDASIEAFRAASKKFTVAQKAYRAKQIGDEEFLKAKAEFDQAQQVGDAAETKFINAKNAPAPEPAAKVEDKGPGDVAGPGGAAVPSELPGAGDPDIYGTAQRVLDQRTAAGQTGEVKPGEGITPEESIQRGRDLLEQGADPEKALEEFEKTKNLNADTMAIWRARGEQLALISRRIESEYGTDSPEFRRAFDALSQWDARIKGGATEAHKIFVSLQGDTDIETGTFTGLQRAHKADTGEDFTPTQASTAKKIAGREKAKQGELGKANAELVSALRNEPPVEPHVRMIADRLKNYFDKRATDALKRIRARRAEGRLYSLPVNELADYADYGASKILTKGIEGAEMTAEWAKEMADELGDYIKPHLQDIWEAAKNKFEEGFKSVAGTGENATKARNTFRKTPDDGLETAERQALKAAERMVADNAKRLADEETKARVAEQAAKTAQQQEAASAAQKTLDEARQRVVEAAAKYGEAATEARVAATGKPKESAEAKARAAQKVLQAAEKSANDAAVRKSKDATTERVKTATAEAARARESAKAAQAALEIANKQMREAAARAAEQAAKHRANPEIRVWEKVKEYLDKGEQSFDDIRAKVATDLGMPVKKVTDILTRNKRAKYAANEVWKSQQDLRRFKQQAKSWLNAQQLPAWQKGLNLIPRAFFGAKVFGHGTVALGTHAAMGLYKPMEWGTYFTNFGRMYGMVKNRAFYEMQVQNLLRNPNYATARRAGLMNDPYEYEGYDTPGIKEYLSPKVADFVEKLTGMGHRGYSVLKLLRQDTFDQQWNALPKTARTPEVAQAIADGINHATGITRAKAPTGSNLLLFAPRLEGSRIAWLTIDPLKAGKTFANWKNASEADRVFAINQVKEKAWVIGTWFGLLALNQGVLSATGSKQKINFTDPMKSDWMKFKVAGMDFSYGNPFITMVRLPIRLNAIRTSDGGKLKNLIYPDESMPNEVFKYIRSQLSPLASFLSDIAFKGDFQNRPLPQMPFSGKPIPVPKRLKQEGVKPYTWKEFLTESSLPIPAEEAAREVWKDGMDMDEEHAKTALKALVTIAVMGGTGGRLTEDYDLAAKKSNIVIPPVNH